MIKESELRIYNFILLFIILNGENLKFELAKR